MNEKAWADWLRRAPKQDRLRMLRQELKNTQDWMAHPMDLRDAVEATVQIEWLKEQIAKRGGA